MPEHAEKVVSQPAALTHAAQSGVLPPAHFSMQWSFVHCASPPKQEAHVALYPSVDSMQLVTHALPPRHFLPHEVMSVWKLDFFAAHTD
jgi:hypothetical protein